MARSRVIIYQFVRSNGMTTEFSVELGLPSLRLIAAVPPDPPAWTNLEFGRCPNCTLNGDECKQCPVAVNLIPAIEAFRDCSSCEEVDITVRTEAREFRKRGPLQVGLSSLVGLIMATSGCPVLDRLRPMAYTHLPFSNATETTYRSIATYLMGQCVRQRRGHTPDWELKQLAHTYDEVRVVNRAFADRIRSMTAGDAGINAMVLLDTFAALASSALDKEQWMDIEPLFA